MTLQAVKLRNKAVALAHSNHKWLLVAAMFFGVGLWLHGQHGSAAVIAISLRDRILDALGDVFMDRGFNQEM
jgi:hypothetical protein